ncbi:HAD-like domain,Pyrimidine 5'-nucleotidase, eukaryotic [Cinara cedri]|uniref:5'-nucleotidase n=2 Tax=Cinara cedri TaxID=506608 RepID=A0A5E4M3J4_9HEMI|nr:HAD-like domain,Pyrimidine 5'-nucleotidase, eukaryotic [Cinara cedri]
MEFVDQIKQRFAATIHIGREDVTAVKIRQLVSGGPDKLQVISDFDRTISRSEYNNQPVLSSFGVFEMSDSLSNDYKKKALELLHKYRPIEDDTQMTVAEKLPYIEQWWTSSSNLLKGLNFKYEDITKSIEKADVKLREGIEKVFEKLYKQNVPLIILSAGIGDVVELILKHNNLVTDNVSVVSNFLKLSKNDNGMSTIQGFKNEKLIHVFNKNEHAYIDTHKNDTLIKNRSNVILLGDSLGDANMDGNIPYNTVLRIGFLNCNLTENEQAHLDRYKQAFDIVLVQDQTMELLNYLLDEIIGVTKSVS